MLTLIGISEVKSTTNKWYERIEVQNKIVDFKIDTGAQTNVIPLSLFNSLPQDIQMKLQETPIRLQVYGGFVIKPVGIINLDVKFNQHSVSSSFFVVSESNCKPILGLELCRLLKLVPYPSNLKVNNIDEFIVKNMHVFSGLGCFPGELNLKLKPNAIPVSNPARRVPFKLMDRLKSTLDLLESKGIIAKADPSEWCSNMVVLEKKCGNLRICIDPQHLNTNLLRDYFVIPTLDQLSSEIGNKKFYCVFDLKDGFYQVKLDDQSSRLCTFSSPYGLYRYLRSPFGLSVLPEHFQKLTQNLFGNIPGVKVYFDDIIVGADTQEELHNIVNKLIEIATLNNVKFNPDKLQYFVPEVRYLGMKFNSLGIKADENRVLAIKNLKAPSNKKELQSILGMINFLRPFIPNLSELIVPFKNLLTKDVIFSWNKIHEDQLNKIKMIICNLSLLSNFDITKPIVVQADASQFAIGCSLLQDDKPVFFASRCLSKTECEYAQIEKELLSVSFAFKKFHNYLYGHKNITVFTDHSPLVSIIKKSLSNIPNNRLRRLRLKLMPYSFELKYLPGKKMVIADLLSRNIKIESSEGDETLTEYVHVVGMQLDFKNDSFEKLVESTKSDPTLSKVIDLYHKGWPALGKNVEINSELLHFVNMKSEIMCQNDLVYFKNRIIIPKSRRQNILDLLHETHTNFNKAKITVQHFFYWPGVLSDLRNFINSCNVCQSVQRSKIKEPLKPHEIPEIPFYKVGVDIAEYKQISYLVLIDYYSRWIEVVKLSSKSCTSVINALKGIFSRYGIPKIVISDNVPFNSHEFLLFCKDWNFDLETISPHHSCSNGLAEKAVGIFKKMLQKSEIDKKDISLYLLNYRNSPVANLEYSPAQLLFSRNLRSKLPFSSEDLKPKVVCDPNVICKKGQTEQYNKTSLGKESLFSSKDNVWVQNIKLKIWEPAKIIKVLNNRSYLVKMTNTGQLYRRNSHFIRKRSESESELVTLDNNLDFESDNEVIDPVVGNDNTNQFEGLSQDLHQSHDLQQTSHTNPLGQMGPYITRSGRTVMPPKRYM
ncbi:hypothetical protein WDU94_005557 [Cyamophila willieti]